MPRWLRRINERAERFNERMHWFGRWVGLPLMSAIFVIAAGTDIGPAIRAARGEGERGTMVVESFECNVSGLCLGIHGEFRPFDGGPRKKVFLDANPKGTRIGDEIEVIAGGGGDIVYEAQGSREWLLILAFLVVGVMGLALWSFRLRRHLSSRPTNGP